MHDRRDFLKTASLVAVGGLLVPRNWSAIALSDGFEPIRRNVGLFTARGGTIGWLISDDAVVVVDAQFPETAETCIAGIKERSSRTIDYLINTHHHGDHTSGNVTFRPHVKTIVAHENVPDLQRMRAMELEEEEPTVADVTFESEMDIDVGDETVSLSYHGVAHTSGDAVIHFQKADVVHMGDLIFNRYPAYVDRKVGARISGWIDVLQTVHGAHTDETEFIFGHGAPIRGKRSDLLYMRDFLGGLLTFTEAGIKAGKSVEEIAKTDRLPDFPDNYSESWKEGIPNCLRVAYEELTEDG